MKSWSTYTPPVYTGYSNSTSPIAAAPSERVLLGVTGGPRKCYRLSFFVLFFANNIKEKTKISVASELYRRRRCVRRCLRPVP